MARSGRLVTLSFLFMAFWPPKIEAHKKIVPNKYLKHYGYLENNTKNGKTKSELRSKALANFQLMSNVPITKKMDSKTFEMMQMSRCGLPDISDKFGQNKVERFQTIAKWNRTLLSWNISKFTRHLPQSSQLLTFQRAFAYWSDVVPLIFTRVESGVPDIDIKFVPSEHGDGVSFDGPGNIIAHSFFPGSGKHEGCAHFDDRERWSIDEDGVDLLRMATHQLGHVLGLGHSTTPNAVMQPFYRGFDANFELHTDDIEAIQTLYGARYTTAQPSRDSIDSKTTSSPISKPPVKSEQGERKAKKTRKTTKAPSSDESKPEPEPETKSETKPGKEKKMEPKQKKLKKKLTRKSICKLKFDAVVHGLDNKTIAFRKSSMYDLSGPNVTHTKIKSNLRNSPINIGAALFHPVTKELFIFKGKKVWKFFQKKLVKGYPKIIKSSPKYDSPNAALLWHNGHIFLFKDDVFWAWNEKTSEIMQGYPRSIKIYWPRLPDNVGAALRLGSTIYFFKNRKYYKLDNVNRAVMKNYPKSLVSKWLKC